MELSVEHPEVRETYEQVNAEAMGPAEGPQVDRKFLSHLHNLPYELRLMVYECMAADDVLFLQPATQICDFYLTSYNLTRLFDTNWRIFNEYRPVACEKASMVKTRVYGFGFCHVGAFLDSLSTRAIASLPSLSNNSRRRFVIHLHIRGHHTEPLDHLLTWLYRFTDRKNGLGIEFEYEMTDAEEHGGKIYYGGRGLPCLMDACTMLNSVLVQDCSVETAVEAGWILYALENPGSHPQTRYLNLQEVLNHSVPFESKWAALVAFLKHAKLEKYIEEYR